MIYKSSKWADDCYKVIASLPELNELNDKNVLITGAGGLICSALIDLLIYYNEAYGGTVRLTAAARNEKKIRERFGIYADKDYFRFLPFDANDGSFNSDDKADFIIYGASNATPNKIIREPVETMKTNFLGLLGILDYAEKAEAKRVLYISSSEVYGKKTGNDPYSEDDYGYINTLNPRNSYSISKKAAETLCVSYSDEYGIDTVIVRPGHIYGPTAGRDDNRVSSAWAYSAAMNNDIVMKSDGSQVRSYCYCLDCASAIIKVLLRGEKSKAYNISNPDSRVSIREMADILAESAGVELKFELPSDEEKRAFNPMQNSALDSASLESLGWRGLFDAPTGFKHTVQIIRESMEESC